MKRAHLGLFILGLLVTLAAACGEKKTVIEAPPHAVVANELAALARLRSIASAEMLYYAESGGSGYASLDDLIRKGMANDPSKGNLTGYKFEVKTAGDGFQALATPEKYGITGKRSFYIDTQNVMRGADKNGAEASASDPQI